MANCIRSCARGAQRATRISFPATRTITNIPTPKLSTESQTKTECQTSRECQKQEQNQNLLTLELERQILNPERAETAQSGTDNKVGDYTFSYDPSTTTPEMEFRIFEEQTSVDGDVDPLFISPANRDFSRLLSPMAGGAVHNLNKNGPSSRGWTRKHKEVHIPQIGRAEYDQFERLLRGLRKLQKKDKMFGSGGNLEKGI